MSSERTKSVQSNPIEGHLRLSNASLARLPGQIRRPDYDRAGIRPGIVHLGIGAFHRAHQAVVIDDLLARGASEWGIVGAGTNGQRIEAILRDEGVACVRTSQAGADDAPLRCAPGEKVVDHDRLVRPVKGADPKMNDARRMPERS